MLDSKERFSRKVDNYVKFRPSYPQAAMEYLFAETGAGEGSFVADIGSGTGKFTKLLLEKGLSVYGVEPNQNMREAAERELSAYPDFHSIDGSAESTALPDESVDLITVAQAFHWFDREACKPEFARILKPEGQIALIWNRRNTKDSDFIVGYESLVKQYGNVSGFAHESITEAVFDAFFTNHKTYHFKWSQPFDFDGLWGRAQSSSYAPAPEHPHYEPLKQALFELFEKHQKNGSVDFTYDTELVIGQMECVVRNL